MPLLKILSQLFGPDKDRHRLVVDSQIAKPLTLEGTSLVCNLKRKPKSPLTIDVYLGFTDTDDQDIKIGQYHFSGEVQKVEDAEKEWRVSIRILNTAADLVKRRSDRWTINNYPIQFKRANEDILYPAKLIDLSAEGIGIDRDEPLQVGEILEISGLATGMQMDFAEPVRFEVRVLPTARKAGLMITQDASDEMKTKLMDFSIQLRQVNRFWNNFLDNIRIKVGKPVQNSNLPSIEFIARQLRRKSATLKMIVDEVQFNELNESLLLLERYESILESLTQLEEEKRKLEPLSSGKRQLLVAFLEKQNPAS
jgi:PilZ domain